MIGPRASVRSTGDAPRAGHSFSPKIIPEKKYWFKPMTQNFYKQRRERRKLKERETRELYKWVLEKGKKRKEKRKREREGEHFAERGGGLSVFPSI